ncbi:T9SS type A sorting domain-containing protein [Flavobacterium paronense]|uniref:T9SS type A sorting domain-containing protein n=1 Tax=Flavobacterium paronense TaxID=1392775 RepID=A0ABV5GDK4_9FLAO|nr:T9SS type A sorting domain-containing protein [Flavobacterium paronense]MDN3678018.1 T9SS type A sorting domain-containing protein [Flavobacterium paronense]
MKLKLHFATLAFSVISFAGYAQVSQNEVAARQWIQSHAKDFKIKSSDTFKLSFVTKGLAGETLRFQQMMNNVPVYHSEIVVNFNPSNELVFTSDSYDSTIENVATTPNLSKEAALDASRKSLNITGEYTVAENNLVVTKVNDQTKLVYKVVTNPQSGNGSWEVLVDAQTGSILSTKDVALYHHKKGNTNNTIKKTNPMLPMAPLAFVSGTAMVYMSDPLSYAHVAYGTTGYVDGNDADTAQLTAARTSVTLPEIDLTAGVYKLKSSYVEITDFETPTTSLFTQATSAFNFTRSNNAFEAVNVFYHLDKSLRYINETLGIACRPSLNGGVLRYDPSGLSGADNSHFLSTTDQIAFGEGCVDDAEDADVIWHEFGHGVHKWMTNGNVSQYLGEGNSDYWAQSYSRSLNQWTASDAASQYMFSWDGHNTCWAGRSTDYFGVYPGDLVGLQGGAAHTDGQIWVTALMQIWDEIGRTKTDKAFLQGLALTNSSTDQQNAARAVRQAAINMNYPCADIQVFTQKFTDRGYVMPALTLTMAAIANQTVVADASNTYTLPSYAALANPITDNCDATLTQSPVIGTVLVPGTYTITMVATSGTTVTRTFQLTITSSLGIKESVKNNFVLYPNPAATTLNVKGNFDSNESVTVFNMLGQTVLTKAVISNEESIDITSLAKGIYNVYFNNAKVTYKFIKE